MRRTSGALTALTLAALLVVGSVAQATPPPGKGGGKDKGNDPAPTGLIYAVEATSSMMTEINPDGSAGTALGCPGHTDLSHDLIGGARWFVWAEELAPVPGGWTPGELFVIDHGAADTTGPCASRAVTQFATETPLIIPNVPRWSPDGTMVAFIGFDTSKFDADAYNVGNPYSAWLADVVAAPGGIELQNIRELTPIFGSTWMLSWSADSRWITLALVRAQGQPWGVFVLDAVTGDLYDVSPDPGRHEFQPAFSPVDDTIAFMRITGSGFDQRHDVFVGGLVFDAGGLPDRIDSVTQLTSKASLNVTRAEHPAWAPDATHLSLSGDSQKTGLRGLYRVRADGDGKAKLISDFAEGLEFNTSVWRTNPDGGGP